MSEDFRLRVIISRSRGFIFLHIHKTGGESITAALEPFLDDSDLVMQHTYERLPRRDRRKFTQYRGLNKHSTANEIREAVGGEAWRNYYKFTFVRDPIDRVVSYYNYCARQMATRSRIRPGHALYYTPRGRRKDPLRWPSMRAFKTTESFSQFIRYPVAQDDPGMQPEVDFICDERGQVDVDFVARFERFDQDFAEIQRTIGIPVREAPVMNVTRQQLVTRSTLSPDDLQYLATMYQRDLTQFNYEV